MVSTNSDPTSRHVADTVTHSAKLLITGAFGVGKTTLISSVSEIPPLRTEEQMTTASVGIDSLQGLQNKTTTTVAMDFGRRTLADDIVLYLFGTPGQRRFWDLWYGLSEGAVGVLVLVDTRRLDDSFEVFDQLELNTTMPMAVAINEFDGAPRYDVADVRSALDLLPETPIVTCDARERSSSVHALITLVKHAMETTATTAHR
ncbi:GTP-binding protein [Saccharopolyspora rosea]|uniref:ATP/GTP-binding protein n=1 Tax=Saccharopolyspora rosea TaxID=524884 RepID=A0ABW3FT22_9PSEU|nr:ATP/GTP-binding protein [Saccharopolyspora rosea]